ncbi:hypothetical protein O9929_05430 [Vibrio lentus]|nr:hypothetical protein [Vibrio lentus]
MVEKPAFTINLADWLAMKSLADKHGCCCWKR